MQTSLWIDGKAAPAERGATVDVLEPATGERLATVAQASVGDAERAIDATARAFRSGPWPRARAVERARVYVDTRAGALKEAGDIVQPIRNGVLMEVQIAGELAELAQGRVPGRSYYNQITLFKSCGTALEDLAAAVMVFERTHAPATGDSLP